MSTRRKAGAGGSSVRSDMKKKIEEKKRKLAEMQKRRQDREQQKKAVKPSSKDSTKKSGLKRSAGGSSSKVGTQDILRDVTSLIKQYPVERSPEEERKVELEALAKLQQQRQVDLDVDIAPKISEKYDIGAQCSILKAGAAGEEKEQDPEESASRAREEQKQERERQAQLRAQQLKKQREENEKKLKQLSEEEKTTISNSQPFRSFLVEASRNIEKALNYPDIFSGSSYFAAGPAGEAERVLHKKTTFMSRGTPNVYRRAVTSIDWSRQQREFMLASYAEKQDLMSLEPDGLVIVWSEYLPQRPYCKFFCESPVHSAMFHPTNPHLILGGTHSGQVVVWDTRAREQQRGAREKETPINRTSLEKGHTHPVYSLQMAQSMSLLQTIITCSTDGMICTWNDDDLVEPTSKVNLNEDEKKQATTQRHSKKVVTPTCFSFLGRDSQTVVLGSDEGNLYKAYIKDNPGIQEQVVAHDAPITQVQFHPLYKNSPRDIADYFLTSSFDWTVKLWSLKTMRPFFTFDSARDYVYDVQWSPRHPALFATGDGMGFIELWDLNRETEVPIHRSSAFADEEGKVNEEGKAISRLKWSEDGVRLAAGTSEGSIIVFEVDKKVALPNEEEATTTFYENMQRYSRQG